MRRLELLGKRSIECHANKYMQASYTDCENELRMAKDDSGLDCLQQTGVTQWLLKHESCLMLC